MGAMARFNTNLLVKKIVRDWLDPMVAKLIQPSSGLSSPECTYNLPAMNAIKRLSPTEGYELDKGDALIQH
jgi:hypothetical protein